MICTIFIEIVRGIPLITVLFMASVMLPLFLPPGHDRRQVPARADRRLDSSPPPIWPRSCAAVCRRFRRDSTKAPIRSGLGYWQKMRLIVLPQALKLVIPGIVNTFIGLFKDTSLVSIIGMFDLLGIVRLNFSDANWASPVTPLTGLIFAGFIFWLFCFGMSRYSGFMERMLDTGHKR